MMRAHLAVAGIVAATLAIAACGQTPSRPIGVAAEAGTKPSDAAAFTVYPDQSDFSCGPLPGLLDDLHPREPVDFLELRRWTFEYDRSGALQPAHIVSIASTGIACAGATDPSACQSTFATVGLERSGWTSPTTVTYGVYTLGDLVGRLTTSEELVTFLGTIDTLGEALLLVYGADRVLSCDTSTSASAGLPNPGWRHNSDGSWEIISVFKTCRCGNSGVTPPCIARERFTVGTNATVRLVDAEHVPTVDDASCEIRADGGR